jgi:hypothetical protein
MAQQLCFGPFVTLISVVRMYFTGLATQGHSWWDSWGGQLGGQLGWTARGTVRGTARSHRPREGSFCYGVILIQKKRVPLREIPKTVAEPNKKASHAKHI